MNIRLLSSKARAHSGWDAEASDFNAFKRLRPSDEIMDALYDELTLYWDALLDVLPDLRSSPSDMRSHATGDELRDHVLFWPIGQELMADVARDLLNYRQTEPATPTNESARGALSALGRIDWNFHNTPWRHLLLIPDDEGMNNWRIRSEERKAAQLVARRILNWQVGLDELADNEVSKLRSDWELMLLPAMSDAQHEELWSSIEEGILR